jgi:hypothetical protein
MRTATGNEIERKGVALVVPVAIGIFTQWK